MTKKLRLYYLSLGAVVLLALGIALIAHIASNHLAITAARNQNGTTVQTPELVADTASKKNTSGWRTYCSVYQKQCFRYPSSWKISSASSASSYPPVVLSDPDQIANVVYQSVQQPTQEGCEMDCSFDLSNVQSLTSSKDIQLVSGVSYDAGQYVPVLADSAASLLSAYGFQKNTPMKITTALYAPVFIPTSHPHEYSSFSIQQTSGHSFSSLNKAMDWFNSPSVRTAQSILLSLYPAP